MKSRVLSLVFALFLVLAGIILYTHLGRDYLFDWDEGIYGELGRQLVIRRDFLVTYWNDAPWFEKPPGVAYLSGLGIILGGESAFGARLLFPLVSLYTLYIVHRLGRHYGTWATGAFAAGLLATFNLFLGRTRGVNADMPLLASIATTVLFLLEKRPSWQIALSLFAGVWFKGVAGLLTLLIPLPLLLYRSLRANLSVLFYFLLITVPWHLYLLSRYGLDFIRPYLLEQVLTRATTQIEFHFESRWYYFSYLYENLGLGVLLVLSLSLLFVLLRSSRERAVRPALFTLVWWLLFPLAIFTLAKTRLFWYILPIYPAIALIISYALTTFGGKTRLQTRVATLLALGVLLQGLSQAYRSVEPAKTVITPPDRLLIGKTISAPTPLLVLVPESERLAEALLPAGARLSSSFRYGGMPSLVFYYRGPVQFFYNVDTFNQTAARSGENLMVARPDLARLTFPYTTLAETSTYLAIRSEEVYAQR